MSFLRFDHEPGGNDENETVHFSPLREDSASARSAGPYQRHNSEWSEVLRIHHSAGHDSRAEWWLLY